MIHEIKINSFNALIDFIEHYYDTNYKEVIEATQSALSVFILTFSDEKGRPTETKEQFIEKVTNHIHFLKTLTVGQERPFFLINEVNSEFEVSKLINK